MQIRQTPEKGHSGDPSRRDSRRSPRDHARPERGRTAYALGLQRSIGNRASGALLQRQDAPQSPEGDTPPGAVSSPHVTVSCDQMRISFATPLGAESYPLRHCDMPSGSYTAAANVTGTDLTLDFGTSAPEGVRFDFSYLVGPGQRDPTQLFTSNGERVSVEVEGGASPEEAPEDLTSHIDTELLDVLARIDAHAAAGSGAPEIPPNARALASVTEPDATYALAVTVGFVQTTGYTVPQGVLATEAAVAAESVAAAEGVLTAQGLATAGSTVVRGGTLARGLIAGGEALLALEAAGGAEVEAATGPPGWVVGAVVLVAAGAAIGVGYLLLSPSATTAPQTGTVPQAVPTTTARRRPGQTCENDVLDRVQAEMHRICDQIPGSSCSPSKVSPKRLARRPCSEIRTRLAALRACMAARQHVQDVCFGGRPDPDHIRAMNEIQNAINACEALERVNCAPGHPMAGL